MESIYATSNMKRYEIDDIVNFRVHGTTCIGQIIKVHPGCYESEYNVRLLSELIVLNVSYKHHPPLYPDEKWLQELGDDRFKLKIVLVESRKINFSIKQEDICRFQNAKTNGERFKYILRGLWKDLVVRKVKFAKLNPNNKLSDWKYEMDGTGNIHINYGVSLSTENIPPNPNEKDAVPFCNNTSRMFPDLQETFYVEHYSHYFGFVSKFDKDKSDIYFSQENYAGLDLDINCTGWFSGWGNHGGGYAPPLLGQFICGTIKEGNKGLCFDRWFTCSSQFISFWRFVMSNAKVTNIDELLASVDTNRYVIDTLSEEQRKIKIELTKKSVRCCDYTNAAPYQTLVKYITEDTQDILKIDNTEANNREVEKVIKLVRIINGYM